MHLSPLLILENDKDEPKPVKTVPEHFTPVSTASQAEVDQVFGPEGERKVGGKDVHFFHIGAPLDMEGVKITLNLERLVERSSGVFGKSGTGKTFLSRLLLAGVIRERRGGQPDLRHAQRVRLGRARRRSVSEVKGLKQIFPGQVSIFTLDDESSRRRRSNPDYTVTIGYDQIEPEDLEMLAGILEPERAAGGRGVRALPQVRSSVAEGLPRRRLGGRVRQLRAGDGKDVRAEGAGRGHGAGPADAGGPAPALRADAQLQLPASPRRTMIRSGASSTTSRQGKNVVLEFGRYGSDLSAYILVANFLTRRIHQQYVEKKEKAFGEAAQGAHARSSSPSRRRTSSSTRRSRRNTIFGTIARELRKYNVTLFIVDQRPSRASTRRSCRRSARA